MLLLDRNNLPSNTVLFLASASYEQLLHGGRMFATDILAKIEHNVTKGSVNASFFTMALDFLFLIGRVEVDEDGRLYVS